MSLHHPHSLNGPSLPRGATDAHVHVFDPARFGYSPTRRYTPGPATVDALLAQHAALGIERCVLVQPSVHDADNRCLLDAIARIGSANCRGIAVVDVDAVRRDELLALHAAGVRGIRLNLAVRHEADPRRVAEQLEGAAAVVDLPGWCLQVHGAATLLPGIAQALRACRVPVVLDHFGGLRAGASGTAAASLDTLLALLDSGRVYVKLSAFYRASSADAPHHADLAPLVRALVAVCPQRLLWGSDWPHTGGGPGVERDSGRIEPFRQVDLAASLAALRSWAGEAATFERILVHNPAELYGFGAA